MLLTALDVLLVLALQHKGFRWIETLVITLIATMMVIFRDRDGLRPPGLVRRAGRLCSATPRSSATPTMLYIALGILGATVMPHNLYLHSSIVQTRRYRALAERIAQTRSGWPIPIPPSP